MPKLFGKCGELPSPVLFAGAGERSGPRLWHAPCFIKKRKEIFASLRTRLFGKDIRERLAQAGVSHGGHGRSLPLPDRAGAAEEPNMGLTALYTGANGMKTLGLGMQVVGNNLANVNTLGFKQQMAIYQNSMATTVGSATVNGAGRQDGAPLGMAQLGLGVSMAEVRTLHTQGAFDLSNEVTDIGIGGIGFFGVASGGETHYTRAGNFRFEKTGYLVDPSGFRLQGRPITDGVEGATTDVRLDINDNGLSILSPQPTKSVRLVSNLGSSESFSSDPEDPFFAMAKAWDGSQEPPLGEGAYSYSSSLRVYDNEGNPHDLTVYFDAVEGASNSGSQRHFEFIVTLPPSSDGRSVNEEGKGLLMAGTMTFGSDNTLTNMSAFTPDGTKNLSNWAPSGFSAEGFPQLDANLIGSDGPTGQQTITLDMGIRNPGGARPAGAAENAGAVGTDARSVAGMGTPTLEATRTTAYDGSSSTLLQTQDGYAEGYLMNLSIGRDGVMTGHYSNGETSDLYRISIYRFNSEYGLKREGNNHFSATSASGAATEGVPDTENYGYVISNALEQSNVDMAREFVTMIMTQRGFQSNSKIVTTQDQMIQHAIQMKR